MDIPLKWVARKAAFLLAMVAASRCSDLIKLSFQELYFRLQESPPGLRFFPMGLRKHDRGHCFQDFFIPKLMENRKLDPLQAITIYLADHRGDVKSLFVTLGKGPVKPPLAQTLAH